GCQLSIEEVGPVKGLWDRSAIDQVLSNLLSNAIKFGAGKPIEVRTAKETSLARLQVRDYGIGIDPARQPYIFDRFERAVSSSQYGGLGLGLYICRRIVDAHGGSIAVASEPGHGATFTVELPFVGPPAGQKGERSDGSAVG